LLILTSDTGLGHRSAANAIAHAMEELHPFEVNSTIVNPVFDQPSPAFLRKTQKDYDKNVTKNQDFYRFSYEISDSRWAASMVESTMVLALYRGLSHIFADIKPDVILNTNLLFNAPMGSVLRACHSDIPFYTVVTDMGDVHSIWFNSQPDGFFVASEDVKAKGETCCIPSEKIKITGIPVDPSFDAARHNQKQERQALGMDSTLPTFLFVGSPRIFGITEYLKELEKASFPFQVVVIAGGNEALFNEVSGRKWNFPIHVRDFVRDMPTWMACADVLVTKAGGLIISEGLAAGLPIILIDHLPGQEDGNVRFVLDNQAGFCINSKDQFLPIIQSWLADDRNLLRQVSSNAVRIGHPHAALDIAETLWQASLQKTPVLEPVL